MLSELDDDRRRLFADVDRGEVRASQHAEPSAPETYRALGNTIVLKTYPQTSQAFYAVEVVDVGGAEVEGGAATTVPKEVVLAWNYGSAIPPVGQPVAITWHAYRFTFRWDG
jgi:hypothetical protein